MEPSKQGGDPSDLDAYYLARPADPSSSRQQPPYLGPPPPPTPLPLLSPLQAPLHGLAPTSSVDEQWQQGEFQMLRQPLSYDVGESSTGARYVPPQVIGSPRSVSFYGEHSPRFAALSLPYPSVAPIPSELSASGDLFCPFVQSHPSVAHWPSTPRSSTSQYPPSASDPPTGLAALFPAWAWDAWHGNGSLDPYASGLQSVPRANQDGSPLLGDAPEIRFPPLLEEFRDCLLRADTPLVYAILSQSSENVILLLAAGDEKVRRFVLAAVKRAVHSVMGSSQMHTVLLALLRACEGRFDELHGIAEAAASSNGQGFLMGVTKYDHGETTLKELIWALAPHRQLCQPLIICLLDERLMEQRNGPSLLHQFFATLPYEYCSILIQFAINNFNCLCWSRVGSLCLVECFTAARNEELSALEAMVLSNTIVIAQRKYSNLFLRQVLECGREQLKDGITERVVADFVSLSVDRFGNYVSLSVDRFGNYVVQACFVPMASLARLQRVLAVARNLSNDQLTVLVQDEHASHVVRKLLQIGEVHCPFLTRALARRIKHLPAEELQQEYGRWVMRIVRKVLSAI